jgi:hypothetical protein
MTLIDSALNLARRGKPVFPVDRLSKKPLVAWKPYQDRIPTRQEVRNWWTEWPDANIGMATGRLSGLMVVDCDSEEAVKRFTESYPEGRRTLQAQTGREGGKHFYFCFEERITNDAGKLLGPGIDIRGQGGFVIVPPSIHANGKAYQWINRNEPLPLASKLREILVTRSKTAPPSNGEGGYRGRFDTAKALAGVPEGQREETLFRSACKLRSADVPQGMAETLILEAARNCQPPFPENIALEKVEWAYSHYQPGQKPEKERKENKSGEEKQNPWAFAKDAPTFLAEQEKEFKGIAKDLLAPGAVTLMAAPRGVGKTQVSHALAVAVATGGFFRNERVDPLRVLLLDRDNPQAIIKKRLRSWGADSAKNLCVLTRDCAPDLKDKKAWEIFPLADYEVLIVDSVGSATEGITEKEGKQTTEVLATILDVARKGPAVLLLTNCTKDALNLKGRGEWADRVDILYEVRDATGFTPSGKKSWWQDLPEASESAWAERAARRKGRIDYRLAFIPSKFRLGAEPEPFCLEIRLPEGEPWTLIDVTFELLQAGEEAMAQARRKEEERVEKGAHALAGVVAERASEGRPILKGEAETFLHEMDLKRAQARNLIKAREGVLWRTDELPSKGHPSALFPMGDTEKETTLAAEMGGIGKPCLERVSEGPISADHAQSGRQKYPRKTVSGLTQQDTPFPPPVNLTGWEEV